MPWRGCSSSSRLVMINRREFVASVTIAIVASRAVVASGEQEQLWEPDGVGSLARIGVLTPDDDPVPESEMRMMAPDGVSIHASRVLWKNGDWRSFADGAPSAAELLMRLKTRLILYAFTSSSYVLGEEADNRLRSEIEKRAGGTKVLFTCPAAVEALHLLGARRGSADSSALVWARSGRAVRRGPGPRPPKQLQPCQKQVVLAPSNEHNRCKQAT